MGFWDNDVSPDNASAQLGSVPQVSVMLERRDGA